MMAAAGNFFKKIFMWCLGFWLACNIFIVLIFNIVPYVTGLPVDVSKYSIRATRNISEYKENQTAQQLDDEEEGGILRTLDEAFNALVKMVM